MVEVKHPTGPNCLLQTFLQWRHTEAFKYNRNALRIHFESDMVKCTFLARTLLSDHGNIRRSKKPKNAAKYGVNHISESRFFPQHI